MEFFTDPTHYQLVRAVHLLGVAIGLGGATITDILFVRMLRDRRVRSDEHALLKTLSGVIWVGVFLLASSGLLLFSQNWEVLLESAKFVAKMSAFVVLIINGLILGLYISPALPKIQFSKKQDSTTELARKRMFAFILGGVSASSWYTAFVMAFVPTRLAIPTWSLALGYVGLLIVVLLGGYTAFHLQRKFGVSANH
ncbi:MAG: hypothetical protein KC653_02240 [Candidatus Andersenbacteria bacterium]|nr:hypothetical protein [Candidatus Andersenbacteria bacterium]